MINDMISETLSDLRRASLARLTYSEGYLYWKDGPRKNKEAGCLDRSTGYIVVRLNGRLCYAHRLIWELETGEIPVVVDHINGNKTDNRIDNLRNCCQHINQLNKNNKLRGDNTSGTRGVSWDSSREKWEAYITLKGRRKHLGRHDTKEQAATARGNYVL